MKKRLATVLFSLLLAFGILISCDPNAGETYRVTYISGLNGVGSVTITYKAGENYSYPDAKDVFENAPTDKYLLGWSEKANDTEPQYTLDSEWQGKKAVLYAVWKDGTRYSLKIDISEMPEADHPDDSVFYYVASPDRDKGWYTDSKCETRVENEKFVVPSYHKQLVFKPNMSGITPPKEQNYYNNAIKQDTSDENSYGYYFKVDTSTTTEQNVNVKLRDGVALTKDVTVKIVFDSWSDNLSEHLPYLEKENYLFLGWTIGTGDNKKHFEQSDVDKVTSVDIELTGMWQKIESGTPTIDLNADEKRSLALLLVAGGDTDLSTQQKLERTREDEAQTKDVFNIYDRKTHPKTYKTFELKNVQNFALLNKDATSWFVFDGDLIDKKSTTQKAEHHTMYYYNDGSTTGCFFKGKLIDMSNKDFGSEIMELMNGIDKEERGTT